MRIDDHQHIDFSSSQADTLVVQRAPKIPTVPRTPKKTRLQRQPFSGTTSELMRIIKKTQVDCLPQYFEQTCDRMPHETAVIYESSRLTYQELDHRANRFAHFLLSRGIRKGDLIGILLERSLDTYIALLGVLKAGAAFVPLDPSFSSELVAFITKDVNLQALVTTTTFRKKTSSLPCPVLELDLAYAVLSVQPEARPQVHIDPASLCYIIYSLGDTERPKGLAISHANIVNFLRVATPIYGVTRNDQVYQGMSIALDLSFEEIWSAWIAGATLVVGPPASQSRSRDFTMFLIVHKITVLFCVPALLATIESDVPSIRSLIIGGESCPDYLVSRWSRSRRRILNTYGPVETTVKATWCELFPGRPITIGSPFPTYQIYILDEQLRPLEDGESGEIFIGGPSVAIGYLNHPELTEDRFIPNPIEQDREIVPRLYRTGDLGRFTPAGEIQYLGRTNTQVMVRSYHIERSEIERTSTTPLYAYGSTLQFKTGEIPNREADTSKLKKLSLLNFKNVLRQVMTDPLYKNSIFNMASTFILGGLGFFFWILIARLYKTEYVGIATTLISIIALLSSFTLMGLNSSLMKYLPKSAHKNELINSSFVIVTLVTVLTSAIFLLGLQIFSPQLLFLRSNLFYIISFTVFIIFSSWNSLIENIFMALRAASNILLKNIIVSTLKLVFPFALIAFGAYGIFASNASAFALGVLVSLGILIFKFEFRPSISVNVSLVKETSAYSFANYITGFMFSMPSLVLPVVILNVLSAKYVAYYYIASMIQNMLMVIPLSAAQALLTEGAYNEADLKKHVKKAITTILVILVPATAIIVFWGNILLQFFGKSYASEAFQFLQLFSISTIFEAVILITSAIMNIKHKMKLLVISNILSAVITLTLSCALISGQLVGIGWGWTIGQAISGLVSIFLITRNYSGTAKRKRSVDSRQLYSNRSA